MNHGPGGINFPRSGLNFLIVALVALALVIAVGFAGLCQQTVPPAAAPTGTPTPPTASPAAAVTAAPEGTAAATAAAKPPIPVTTLAVPPQAPPVATATPPPGVKPPPPPGVQPTPAPLASPLALASPAAGGLRDEWGILAIQPKAPVKLGFAAALSGPYQQLGTEQRNAVELAVADKMAAGGLKGHPIQLDPGDDRCDGPPAVDLARRYGGDPATVGVVGHMCSASTLAALDIYNQTKLTLISPSATTVELTSRNLPVFFRTVASDGFQGRVAANLIARSLNVGRLAIVHDRSAYGYGVANAVRNSFTAAGGQVVAFEGIARGQTDFAPLMATLSRANPEAVYFGGVAVDAARLVRTLRGSPLQVRFISDEAVFDDEFIRQAGPAGDGAYVTAYRISDTPIGQQFRQRYEQKYGPIGTYSRQAYDAALILLNAAERIGQLQPDGMLLIGRKMLADAVRATRCDNCVSGPIWFEPNGDLANVQAVTYQVRGGKFEEVAAGR